MLNSKEQIPARLRRLLVEFLEVKPEKVTLNADLYQDLGAWGQDAGDLFIALDEEFDVDWTGLDLGIHFGSEGWGLPFPWHLKDSHHMYKMQPCSVEQLVTALETGRWHGTRIERRHPLHILWLYAWSIIQITFVAGLLIASFVALLNR